MATLVYSSQRVGALTKAHEDELAEIVKIFGDSINVVHTENGVISERFVTAVSNLDDALGDNDRLRERIQGAENRLALKVRQVDELTASMLTLELERQNAVVLDSTGNSGFVELVEDTAGVHIRGKVYWPSGKSSLIVSRDPLNFIITLQTTESGLVAKKTIEFPDQPWITVEDWQAVIVDENAIKKEGFFKSLFSGFGSLGVLAGVNGGSGSVGGDIGLTAGDWQAMIDMRTDGNTSFHIIKRFSLW